MCQNNKGLQSPVCYLSDNVQFSLIETVVFELLAIKVGAILLKIPRKSRPSCFVGIGLVMVVMALVNYHEIFFGLGQVEGRETAAF